jgi:hypothetical protein
VPRRWVCTPVRSQARGLAAANASERGRPPGRGGSPGRGPATRRARTNGELFQRLGAAHDTR